MLDILEKRDQAIGQPYHEMRSELFDYEAFIRYRFEYYFDMAKLPYFCDKQLKRFTGFVLPVFERDWFMITLKKSLKNYKYRSYIQWVAINQFGGMYLEIYHSLTREPTFFRRFIPSRFQGIMSWRQSNENVDISSMYKVVNEILKLAIKEAELRAEQDRDDEVKIGSIFNL